MQGKTIILLEKESKGKGKYLILTRMEYCGSRFAFLIRIRRLHLDQNFIQKPRIKIYMIYYVEVLIVVLKSIAV